MKDLAKSINLNEYNISVSEFTSWVVENNMEVYAVATQGGNGSKIYFFNDIEDFTAFTLKFSKKNLPTTMGYKGVVTMDVGIHNCPYVPIEYDNP